MTNTTHNGWSNYATWRVNLEIVDSIAWVKEDFVHDETELTVHDLADYIKNIAFSTVFDQSEGNDDVSLMRGYADAFMGDVNWYEIAKHMAKTYPEWNVKQN